MRNVIVVYLYRNGHMNTCVVTLLIMGSEIV